MGFEQRIPLIERLEQLRDSVVICYLTSLRNNVPTQMAEDQVRVMFDHLGLLPSRPVKRLDVFLASNGGSGVVPWRLVSLFREFASEFNVIIPYRAYSAASLLALGADEIVMHPFAELGPIDPTVSNDFNPVAEGTGQRLGISVEDVVAYVNFIKSTVGITHEDELVRAIEILANKVHPLALGNVERFLSQSRMIARKILKTHTDDEHAISEIVENMASKLYFHGHPINRKEAKEELKLKVRLDLQPELETSIWDLYRDYEDEFENTEPFDVGMLLGRGRLAAAQAQGQQVQGVVASVDLLHAIIESTRLSSSFRTSRRYELVGQPPAGMAVQEDVLSQGWTHSRAPQGDNPTEPSDSQSPDAPIDELA